MNYTSKKNCPPNASEHTVHAMHCGEGLLIKRSSLTTIQNKWKGGLAMLKGGVYSRKIPEPCARGSSRSWRDQDQKETVLSLMVPTAYLRRQPQTHHSPGGQDLRRAQGPSGWRVSLRACGDGRSVGSLAPGRTTAGGSATAARCTLYLRGHGAGRWGWNKGRDVCGRAQRKGD